MSGHWASGHVRPGPPMRQKCTCESMIRTMFQHIIARSTVRSQADPMIISSTLDFREAARRRLPRFLFDYADGGAYNEYTLQRNVADLAQVALRQRVLQGCATVDLKTTLFGRERPLPVML